MKDIVKNHLIYPQVLYHPHPTKHWKDISNVGHKGEETTNQRKTMKTAGVAGLNPTAVCQASMLTWECRWWIGFGTLAFKIWIVFVVVGKLWQHLVWISNVYCGCWDTYVTPTYEYKFWRGNTTHKIPHTGFCLTLEELGCEGSCVSWRWQNDMKKIRDGVKHAFNVLSKFYGSVIWFTETAKMFPASPTRPTPALAVETS